MPHKTDIDKVRNIDAENGQLRLKLTNIEAEHRLLLEYIPIYKVIFKILRIRWKIFKES